MRYFSAMLLCAWMIGCTSPAAAAPAPNLVGQFGFDWLQPEKTKCAALTPATQASIKSCEYSDKSSTQSFAGKGDFYKCEAGAHHEYMIYKTKERCAEEFDIMKSNGP